MRSLLLVTCVLVVACKAKEPAAGGDCEEVSSTDLAMDAQSALGFSGAELAALVEDYPFTTGHWLPIDATADVQIHSESFDDGATYVERALPDGSEDATCRSTLDIVGATQIESYVPEVGGADIFPRGPISAATLDAASVTATISGTDVWVSEQATGMAQADFEDVVYTLTNEWTFGAETTLAGKLSVEGTKISDGQAYTADLVIWPE